MIHKKGRLLLLQLFVVFFLYLVLVSLCFLFLQSLFLLRKRESYLLFFYCLPADVWLC